MQYGVLDTEANILIIRLWKEQEYRCIYCNKEWLPQNLKEEGNLQIDHIIPESKSFDNSYNNKILSCSFCNKNKGQKTPYMWLGSDNNKWEEYRSRIFRLNLPEKKQNKLLNTQTMEHKKYINIMFVVLRV